MDELFNKFWLSYPNKKSKGAAKKSFDKVMKECGGDEEVFKKILLAIDAQKREKKRLKEAGIFCPDWAMPSTWLNNQRWEDEVVTHQDIESKRQSTFCSCGSEATHGRMCSICFQRKVIDPKTGWDVKLRESLKRALEKNPKKSGESWAEWGKRLLTEGKFGNTYKPTSHNSQKN